MTRLAKLAFVGAMILSSAATTSAAEPFRRRPEYRPYIMEVGAPRVLTRAQFTREIYMNTDLQSWVRNYGFPDVAEYQRVVPEYGWADYEIRVYYFDYDLELAFGRVKFMPAVTSHDLVDDYGLVKYEGRINPSNLQRVRHAPRLCGSTTGTSADRIIAAADRATAAAEAAEREALRAADAAQRAEGAVGRMDAGFREGLRK